MTSEKTESATLPTSTGRIELCDTSFRIIYYQKKIISTDALGGHKLFGKRIANLAILDSFVNRSTPKLVRSQALPGLQPGPVARPFWR
jgi:hypothetical protein